MFSKSKKEAHTYGIIGLGRFGFALAMELATAGADIIVLDRDEEKLRELREYTENAYVVKTLDKKTLADTGIGGCDIAVVGIGEQMDISILTTLHLVGLGVPRVIAKATNAEHGEILERLGAEVVYPERDIALRLAHRLEASRVLDYIQLGEKLNIAKQRIPDRMIGKSVWEADFRAKYGLNIIAIENGKELLSSIDPQYIFRSGDILYVSGSKGSIEKLG